MRKAIIAFTFVVIVAMCLYPPWLRTKIWWAATHTEKIPQSSQYAFLLTPPEEQTPNITASIDIRRLAVQCFIVLLVGGGLAYLWPEKKKLTDNTAV